MVLSSNKTIFDSFKTYVKFLCIAYMISILLLLFSAFLLYKFKLESHTAQLLVYGIYIIACMSGGFFIGKSIGQKRFLWGLLFGLLYIVILFIISMAFPIDTTSLQTTNPETGHMATVLVICLASGCIGGMIS